MLQPCILGTLVDAMRRTPRGDTGWRLGPAKRDRQPCAYVLLQRARSLSLLTQKITKNVLPNVAVGTVRVRLQDTARKFTQARSSDPVGNYNMFELDHNITLTCEPLLF